MWVFMNYDDADVGDDGKDVHVDSHGHVDGRNVDGDDNGKYVVFYTMPTKFFVTTTLKPLLLTMVMTRPYKLAMTTTTMPLAEDKDSS